MKRLIAICVLLLTLCGCSAPTEGTESSISWSDLEKTGQESLRYATEFQADYYGSYTLLTIREVGQYLLVPEGEPVPGGLPENITVLQQPLNQIYLAATSAMDLYRGANALSNVRLTSLDAPGWYIEEAKQALAEGRMVFAGKYSAPDYERIFSEGCNLAVESTMIYHTPEVKEQLERLGIPVLVERSSYESHPLGRLEWIKLHGLLTGHLTEAAEFFDRTSAAAEETMQQPKTGKTVAFFSVSSTGTVTVRKSSDYIAQMIGLAGGEYIFSDLDGDSATSTLNMQMESFFDRARDADILIYNSTTAGEVQSLDALCALSGVFRQLPAVQSGNVYCTGKNFFQQTTALAPFMAEIGAVVRGENTENLQYLHKLS